MKVSQIFCLASFSLLFATGFGLFESWSQHSILRRLGEASTSFEAAANEMDKNILLSRAGMLRNYDSIVAMSDRWRASLDEIDELSKGTPSVTRAVDTVRKKQEEKEILVEQFKSENALLQNSVSYFAALSKELQRSGDASLSSDVSLLAAAMLSFSHSPSDDNANALLTSISGLNGLTIRPSQVPVRDSLVAHTRVILSTQASVDNLVESVIGAGDADRMKHAVVAEEARNTSQTQAYLIGFSLTAAFAAVASMALGLQVRAKVRTGRARKELGKIVSDMTLRSIDAGSTQVNIIVEQTLQRLADWAGADRARYVSSGDRRVSFDSAREPSRKSRAALEEYALTDSERHFFYIRRGRAVEKPEFSEALAGVDVSTWFGYRSATSRGTPLLTLECRQGGFHYDEEVLSSLSIPLEMLSEAIHRLIIKAEQHSLAARLNQAQRLEAVGTFASGIAHNLNNITAAIRGHAEMAGETLRRETLDRHIKEILKGADRAHNVVSDVMAFGRSDSMVRKPTDLSALVREAKRRLSPSLPVSVSLVVNADGEIMASIEAHQIDEVLANLVRNAWESIEASSGLVRVCVEAREETAALRLSHGTVQPGHYAVLTVADNGEGMDESTQDRLFEPFFSTRQGHVGLGLATVSRVVADHGGALQVESALGSGSSIQVWLPVDPDRSTGGVASKIEASGERILILGRNKSERLKTEETVAALGYEPVGRPSVDFDGDKFPTSDFDAVVMLTQGNDIGEHLEQLTAFVQDIPVVVVGPTEYLPGLIEVVAVTEVLPRPVTPAALAVALARAIHCRFNFNGRKPGPVPS